MSSMNWSTHFATEENSTCSLENLERVGTSGVMRLTSSEVDFISSEEFKKGREFEYDLAETLRRLGYEVLHNHQLPDLFVVKDDRAFFIECKAKDRMKQHPATGYDLHSHERYKEAERLTGVTVVVAFRENNGDTYAQTLKKLSRRVYKDFTEHRTGRRLITFDIDAFLDLNKETNWNFILQTIEVI